VRPTTIVLLLHRLLFFFGWGAASERLLCVIAMSRWWCCCRCIRSSSSNKEEDPTSTSTRTSTEVEEDGNEDETSTNTNTNTTLLINVLLHARWNAPAEIVAMTKKHDDQVDHCRTAVIHQLHQRCGNTKAFLQQLSDGKLAEHVLLYQWLVEARIRTRAELAQMTLEEHRNTAIVETMMHQPKKYSDISQLQRLTTWELTAVAHQWWLPQRYQPLIRAMTNVNSVNDNKASSSSSCCFGLHDNLGNSMDTLKVLPMMTSGNNNESKTDADTEDGGYYLGIYHTYKGSFFQLQLAKTVVVNNNNNNNNNNNAQTLHSWEHITNLGDRSHQGDIRYLPQWGTEGFLVANEEAVPGSGNNIRVRFYPNLAALFCNEAQYSMALPRTFSTGAEGTPNIISMDGDSPESSSIFIGFHYYRDCVVDRQAYGVLTNFSEWTAWNNEIVNTSVEQMGFGGNIGGRYRFAWGDDDDDDDDDSNDKDSLRSNMMILEAQQTPHDWASWRLLVGNGSFFTPLELRTPHQSTSFANPCVVHDMIRSSRTTTGQQAYIATAFLPSQGNGEGEAGELLYRFLVP